MFKLLALTHLNSVWTLQIGSKFHFRLIKSKMIILGISITHDGTLTVLKDGVNIFSIAEERLNRTKAYIGFPFLALK